MGSSTVLEESLALEEFWKQAVWGLVFGLTWNLKRSGGKITKYSIPFVRLVRHITFLDQICHRG